MPRQLDEWEYDYGCCMKTKQEWRYTSPKAGSKTIRKQPDKNDTNNSEASDGTTPHWTPSRFPPGEILAGLAAKKSWTLQYQAEPGTSYNKSVWGFGLIIRDRTTQRLVVHYRGTSPCNSKEHALNKISTYALLNVQGWNLCDTICEPFRSDFMRWRDNRRKRAHSAAASTEFEEEIFHDDSDTKSVSSFNTSFSCATADVQVRGCTHFNQRSNERKSTLLQQQLCLKYGQKTEMPNGRVEFRLGSVKMIQSGSNQGDTSVTIITGVRDVQTRRPQTFTIGQECRGIVATVIEANTRRPAYGFIEAEHGCIFFSRSFGNKKSSESSSSSSSVPATAVMPAVGDAVKFRVSAGKNPHIHEFQAKNVVVVEAAYELREDCNSSRAHHMIEYGSSVVHAWMEQARAEASGVSAAGAFSSHCQTSQNGKTSVSMSATGGPLQTLSVAKSCDRFLGFVDKSSVSVRGEGGDCRNGGLQMDLGQIKEEENGLECATVECMDKNSVSGNTCLGHSEPPDSWEMIADN
jgi:hypothetical protein